MNGMRYYINKLYIVSWSNDQQGQEENRLTELDEYEYTTVNISGTRKETTFLKRGYFKKRKRERKVVSTISGTKYSSVTKVSIHSKMLNRKPGEQMLGLSSFCQQV